MIFWIHFTYARHNEFFFRLLVLLLYPFIILSCQSRQIFHHFNIWLFMADIVFLLQSIRPVNFIQIEKHPLFNFTFSVVDGDRVVIFIETSRNSLETGFLYETNIGCGLPWFYTSQYSLLIDWSKCIYYNFAFNWLYWVDHNTYSSRIEHFLRLLGLNVGSR